MTVYNLSNMTRQEAEDFVGSREGRTCVRFYRRYDGTVLTSDCPIGARALKHRLLRTALAMCAAIGLLLVTPLYAMSVPFRALGSADPLKSVRGWMQPDCLIQVLGQTPPPEPAIMGDFALSIAPQQPAPPTNYPQPVVLTETPSR